MSIIAKDFSPNYICHDCSQMFHLERSLESHYFCNLRSKQKIEEDRGAITVAKMNKCSVTILPYNNSETFKEWVEDVKQRIYQEKSLQVKEDQTKSIILELLSLRVKELDLYTFNECYFLLPELNQKSVPELFTKIVKRFDLHNPNVRYSQRRYLALLLNRIYPRWKYYLSERDVPFRERCDFTFAVYPFVKDYLWTEPEHTSLPNVELRVEVGSFEFQDDEPSP